MICQSVFSTPNNVIVIDCLKVVILRVLAVTKEINILRLVLSRKKFLKPNVDNIVFYAQQSVILEAVLYLARCQQHFKCCDA